MDQSALEQVTLKWTSTVLKLLAEGKIMRQIGEIPKMTARMDIGQS